MRKFVGIIFFAACLAVSVSCSRQDQSGGEYILFEIHGSVTDQDGNPLEGIIVSSGMSDEVRTNQNGNFTFHGRCNPTEYVRLSFEDKDGEANGGSFLKRDENIPVKQKLPGDEDGNFKGKYFAQDVKVIMIGKTSEIQPLPVNMNRD